MTITIRMFIDEGYGLWASDGLHELDYYPISDDLKKEISLWILDADEDITGLSEDEFDEWGRRLSVRLQEELGDAYFISYEQ